MNIVPRDDNPSKGPTQEGTDHPESRLDPEVRASVFVTDELGHVREDDGEGASNTGRDREGKCSL